jgi:hypothetical protein
MHGLRSGSRLQRVILFWTGAQFKMRSERSSVKQGVPAPAVSLSNYHFERHPLCSLRCSQQIFGQQPNGSRVPKQGPNLLEFGQLVC